MTATNEKSSFGKKLGWLVLIWAASITSLAVVSLLIKLIMNTVGFSS
ncbi:Protein of unknown function [Methylophilus rhizosphaerae]|uniref:DUF2474 domain-containing protein n=1 Tax=Methylophilus rhizosphaerae TaxID=492660 RepID=A0A1G9B6E1_9PROT|nr:DUF2474 domain-containing protein [Methylophilus rhizosphaerae]SDK35063.1 Protein of unknown function [Methylophilus rhizosphaerae]